MESREMYKEKYSARIHAWTTKVDNLIAEAESLTAQARIDLQPQVDTARVRFEAARAQLHSLAEASDEGLEDAVVCAEHAWSEFKAAVEGAYDAIKDSQHDRWRSLRETRNHHE